jgi:hypothetical protein
VNLKEEDWHIQENQNQVGRAKAVCIQARYPNNLINLNKMTQRLGHEHHEVARVDKNEEDEVFSVTIAKAVIEEWAVMVKHFHAFVADGAVEGML